ncbi:type II toxin-antitoxin system HicA family toxin [Spirosoma foliorum]|uniref:Type II toxin-antitoxin system HicA family toxin n=1 Tax=Spirosoma foliorum TaxID=2710596 RepID=A0A7G5GV58_9BACT|nr:type II toxin-antitoxin system HicA family toxin [Spirosoma foliorum]QMW02750.1 type II toxin-antitoxin system HicA family toxin [Spirosoma foliorum]
MKLPRDLNGSELIKRLERYGYQVHHQTGSHVILRTNVNGEHSISVPYHKPLKVGTLNSILSDVADHLGLDKQTVTERLLSRK